MEIIKDWLRTNLRRFLCEHKNAKLIRQITTTKEIFNPKDPTIEPGGIESEILYFRKYFQCSDCGDNNVIFTYKR